MNVRLEYKPIQLIYKNDNDYENEQTESGDSVLNVLLKIYSEICQAESADFVLNILLKIYSEKCPS